MNIFTSFFFASKGRYLSEKSYSHVISFWRRTANGFAISIAILGLTACAGDDSQYHWKTSAEAIADYREFCEQSRTADDITMEGIAKDIVGVADT